MFRPLISTVLSGALALTGAALVAAAPGYASQPAGDFLRTAVAADNGEIALAKLAERRGASSEVRSFARVLSRDHTRTREQALDIARLSSKESADATTPEARAELRKLRALSGKSFDREFVRYMAEDHRKDVRAFRVEALGRHGRASRLAQMTIPVLRKHLRMAESLAPRVGLRGLRDQADN